jgi:hypothetical protein
MPLRLASATCRRATLALLPPSLTSIRLRRRSSQAAHRPSFRTGLPSSLTQVPSPRRSQPTLCLVVPWMTSVDSHRAACGAQHQRRSGRPRPAPALLHRFAPCYCAFADTASNTVMQTAALVSTSSSQSLWSPNESDTLFGPAAPSPWGLGSLPQHVCWLVPSPLIHPLILSPHRHQLLPSSRTHSSTRAIHSTRAQSCAHRATPPTLAATTHSDAVYCRQHHFLTPHILAHETSRQACSVLSTSRALSHACMAAGSAVLYRNMSMY